MYNRYINADGFEIFPPSSENVPGHDEPIPPTNRPPYGDAGTDDQSKQGSKAFGALRNILGNNIKLPEFNSDTILLLVLVYFLVADSDDKGSLSDTVLIIAALFLLGI